MKLTDILHIALDYDFFDVNLNVSGAFDYLYDEIINDGQYLFVQQRRSIL